MSRRGGKTYFLSDLHLGAGYVADTHEHQRRVVRFLRAIEPDAEAVYLLGDVLDYWFEYRTVAPQGYVRFFGELARLADAGVKIVWMTGNHDIWFGDYLRREIGLELIDCRGAGIERTIAGAKFFLGHGDNFGRQPRSYLLLRRLFHSRVARWLFSGIHPRWTVPLAHAWSSHSRKAGGYSDWTAIDSHARRRVDEYARELAAADPDLRYIIIGHHHAALDEAVTPSCRLVVLGNWITSSDYAVWDGHTLTLTKFEE